MLPFFLIATILLARLQCAICRSMSEIDCSYP